MKKKPKIIRCTVCKEIVEEGKEYKKFTGSGNCVCSEECKDKYFGTK